MYLETVASLLAKYLLGPLTPTPQFPCAKELDKLYTAWSEYLRSVVETLVAQSFEITQMADKASSKWWWQSTGLLNHKSVRSFYKYQSRLLQTGFSALFGPKFQELVLKLSFTLANSASTGAATQLPNVLGVVARAETSESAARTQSEIALIGDFVINHSDSVRIHPESLIAYATKSVELDISLLEDIRDAVCRGLEAFYTVSGRIGCEGPESSPEDAVSLLSTYLMSLLEQMAQRLDMFHTSLAQHSISTPSLQKTPAQVRWQLLRQCVRDGSFFVLAQNRTIDESSNPAKFHTNTNFDKVLARVRQELSTVELNPKPQTAWVPPRPTNEPAKMLPQTPSTGPNNTVDSHEDTMAMRRMSKFIDTNIKAMNRLSRVPLDFNAADFSASPLGSSKLRTIVDVASAFETSEPPPLPSSEDSRPRRKDSAVESPDRALYSLATGSPGPDMRPGSGLAMSPRMSPIRSPRALQAYELPLPPRRRRSPVDGYTESHVSKPATVILSGETETASTGGAGGQGGKQRPVTMRLGVGHQVAPRIPKPRRPSTPDIRDGAVNVKDKLAEKAPYRTPSKSKTPAYERYRV